MPSVAFFGLGVMGGGMAGRLLDAQVPLTVWNRRRERAEPFGARGAVIADSPRQAAEDADILIAMVSDDDASRMVWLGADGALAGARPGAIVIESSTLSPAWIEDLAVEVGAHGCELIDAPVTGSKSHAATGQLLFLAGGAAATVERVRPVLAEMSRDILHLGPTGSGARMKLINNFLCGVQAASLAEAIAFVERSGLDRDIALRVLSQGAPGSPLVNAVGPRMANADYAVNFELSLMRKDLRYSVDDAERFGLALRTASSAMELYDAALGANLGRVDFSAIVETLRRR